MKQRLKLAMVLITFCCLQLSMGQSFPTVKILDNGNPENKINWIYLGDGYQSHEMDKYISDVTSTVNGMFEKEPYKSIKSSFNVYAIKVPSNVSGAAEDPNELIDNYFGSTFNYAGIERLLVASKTEKVNSVLASNFPDYDQAIVIVNTSRYGGSGGAISCHSTHNKVVDLALHELGHSYAKLADEYTSGTTGESPNRTANNDPNTVKWKEFMGQDGIGIYAHDAPHDNWYRPHQNCKMRHLSGKFCLVCQKQILDVTESILNQGGNLDTPTNLKSYNVKSTSFGIYWSTVDGASSYEVALWDGSSWQVKGSTANYYYMFYNLPANSTQYAKVRAKNPGGTSEWTNYITVSLVSGAVPETPTNLSASSILHYGFYAKWDKSENADGYELSQWDGDKWISQGTTTDQYKWLYGDAGTTEYFRVRAYNGYGNSSYSAYKAINLPAAAPEIKKVEKHTKLQINALSIFPNPANDILHIISDESGMKTVKIYTLSGKLALVKVLEEEQALNIGQLSPGFYNIVVQMDNLAPITKKLIKQ